MTQTLIAMNQQRGEVVSVLDFGATGDGTTSDVAAINAAITYALSGSALGAATEENYRTIYFPAGAYLIDSQITIPSNAYLIFMGEGHLYNASILVQGFAGSMFVNTSGNNAVYHCLNLVFQGDKSTYVGSYHGIEVQSGADAVHLNLINCVFRDFGGWGVTLNTLFSGFMVNCIFAYNKAGGLRVSGGTGNVINVTTQNNLGAGIEILAQGTTGTMFIEGDLIDNNPAGLNLSNRALKLGGGYNRITATINTNSNNDKTPIETTAQGNEMLITGTGKGTATNWATLGASATYNYIGGNIGSSLTGDASAIATARRGINAGSSYYLTNGETLFASGSLTPAGTDKGTRVGFDTAVNRGYVYPTEPGTANYPLDLIGSFICLKSPFASDQTAVASTLGTVVRRLEIQNQAGGTLGYIPIYNNIT